MKRKSGPKRNSTWVMFMFLLASFQCAVCFKALFVFPFPTRSHFGALSIIAEELARKGHEVTVLSHFPQENANYKEIIMDTEPFFTSSKNQEMNMTKYRHDNQLITRIFSFRYFKSQAVTSKEVLSLVKSNANYDVIVGEVGFFLPFIAALGHKFNAPVVDVFPSSPFAHVINNMGNPLSISHIPDYLLPLSEEMSFLERFENMVNGLWDLALFKWYLLPAQEELVKKYFTYPGAESMPSLSTMVKNISLMLVNTHFSIEYSRPFAPNVVEIGGMHLKPTHNLPQDLHKFMDEAEYGVIYISFGSVVKGTILGEYRALQIANAIKRLRQRVIIKWDDPKPFQDTKNILVLPWAPQQDILAHPNLLLFISHGGFNSLIEATHAGIPVLGIPVFADQFHNIRILELRGIGEGLDLAFTSQQLYESITRIINTPSENAKRISRRTQDRPVSALDLATYWIEYVVRHKGAPHLRPASVNLPSYQYLLLDALCVMFLVIFLTYKIISKVCCSKSKSSLIKFKSAGKKLD